MLGSFKAALLGIIKINGLNRVTVDRNHVYAAAWSDWHEVKEIDILILDSFCETVLDLKELYVHVYKVTT